MSLTNEQAIKRFKIAILCIPISLLLFFISIFLTIFLEIRFPLPMLVFPLIMMSMFYFMYLLFKYPEARRQWMKKNVTSLGGMATDMLEGLDEKVIADKSNSLMSHMDEKVIGNKLGGVINHMTTQQQANSNPTPAIKIRCQHCQTLNEETDKFCSNCGKPL